MKIVKKNSTENCHFYSLEKSLYIAWACFRSGILSLVLHVKSMEIPGTDAIRTQIQPSKPKREITKNTSSKNTKRTYGQLIFEILFNLCTGRR